MVTRVTCNMGNNCNASNSITFADKNEHLFQLSDTAMCFKLSTLSVALTYLTLTCIRSYKIVQKLSPKHAARGVAQSPYPTYRHGKACLSKQPPWRAAGDPHLTHGRSRVRTPGPAGALRALFFSTLSSFLLREIVVFEPSPPNL